MTNSPPPNTNLGDGPDLGNTLPATDSRISHPDQITYWTVQSADVNGMLGGYPQLSRIDLQGSKNFVTKMRRLTRQQATSSTTISDSSTSARPRATSNSKSDRKIKLAVDCGAGIGRITANLLISLSETVDIVEPVAKFTDELAKFKPSPQQGSIGDIYNVGLENWIPDPSKTYDLVWVQWCLGYLKDRQAVDFLQRASKTLSQPEGWIMVKDNLSTDTFGEDIFDDADSSVTRSDAKFKAIFEEANLRIVSQQLQSSFPAALYPVKMYALRPK